MRKSKVIVRASDLPERLFAGGCTLTFMLLMGSVVQAVAFYLR